MSEHGLDQRFRMDHWKTRAWLDASMEESMSRSQNFCLRLSDGSSTIETCDSGKKMEDDVVVISDSSFADSPVRVRDKRLEFHKKADKGDPVYILGSSDSDEDKEERFFQKWRTTKKPDLHQNSRTNSRKTVSEKNVLCYTSDETSSSNSEVDSRCITNSSGRTTSSYVIASTQNENCNSNMHNQVVNRRMANVIFSANQRHGSDHNAPSKLKNQKLNCDSQKLNTPTKLTKKDARNILRNIKSTRAVYESPKAQNIVINESIDEEVHPALVLKKNAVPQNRIIDETLDSETTELPSEDVINLPCTYTIKPADPVDPKDLSVELSERKKKQISQWLMTNSPNAKSDSSFSVVPPSNRSSISSGNSSLERLEQNYETPNNRGRIRNAQTSGRETTLQDSTKTINSLISKQATLHDFMQRSKDRTILGQRTPKSNKPLVQKEKTTGPRVVENVNIMECADILDKLYGSVWRDKADALLPTSEPRKQTVPTMNRAVQTERKQKYRTKTSGSDDSDSPLYVKQQVRPGTKSTTKSRKRDSFINDELSSASGDESLYYTALTNPRVSTNTPKPIPTSVQRVFEICDSDSEVEQDDRRKDKIGNIGRRRLSFSDDQDDDHHSSTSEFDPGDEVPPKRSTKKDSAKPPKQAVRTDAQTLIRQRTESKSSFLASLSESVPLTNAHPDARVYRKDYKNKKDDLCKRLFKLYNERVFDKQLPEDMSIEWNVRMRGTAGFCYNKKSIKALGGRVKSSRIVLATKVLDTPDRLRDTLIHEMCHAAAWLINDVSDGHGPFWTAWANKAMKTFPELPPIRRCHDYKIKTKFTYKCTGCGYSIGRHSKSLDIERKRCGHCYGKFELLVNRTTKSGTVQMQTPKREPSAFALYVKENYNSVKREKNLKHADIMRVLGQQFSAVKIAKRTDHETNSDTAD